MLHVGRWARYRTLVRNAALSCAGIALSHSIALAQSTDNFYAGKRITLVIGYQPGSGYDQYARTFAMHVGKYIPGNPVFVPQNMLGAGTRVAANHLYNVAAKDGTALGIVDQNIPLDQALGYPGVQFDVRKFNWIGNMVVINNVLVVWHTSGIKTIADATQKQILMGSNAGTSPALIYPQVSNSLLGTKFKIIAGYADSTQMNLAMERGEVQGRGSNSWQSYKVLTPDWVSEKKIIVLFQVGSRRERDLPDVPLLTELAKNDEDRAVFETLSAPISFARAIIAPPEVPTERVALLRRAFDSTMKDPAFLEDTKKQGIDINPLSGEEVQKIVDRTLNTPSATIAHLKQAILPRDATDKDGKPAASE